MDVRIYEDKGLIWLDLGPSWSSFNEALADAVSSLSPRGEPPALSTYWIDRALAAEHAESGAVVAGGNSTTIVRTRYGVRAESDYELFDAQEMPLAEFLSALQQWRDEVVAAKRERPGDLPQHGPYQRNPFDSVPGAG